MVSSEFVVLPWLGNFVQLDHVAGRLPEWNLPANIYDPYVLSVFHTLSFHVEFMSLSAIWEGMAL